MNVINIGLLLCLLWACNKWFVYYCATRGLLYYLADEYNDWLEVKKAQELTDTAMKRTVKEFFGIHKEE